MPINQTTDLVLYPSASNPGDDSTQAGGGIGSTPVAGASPGEIFPRLAAPAVGTVDVNVNRQFQKAFWKNANASSDLLVARIFLRNGLFRPASGTGQIFIILTNAGDAGKQVRLQEVVGGVVLPESINTPSATGAANAAAGVQAAVQWVERAQLVDVNSGAQVSALGDVQIWWGTNVNTATLLGIIPGPSANGLQWSWATGEVQLLGISSLNDTATITNRRTSPGTFTQAYTYSSGVVITLNSSGGADTLGHGQAQGFWAQQTLQPGMPPADNVQYCWTLEGESGA